MNWLLAITLTESACETAPPDCPAVLRVKLEAVMLDWLPESTNIAPPAVHRHNTWSLWFLGSDPAVLEQSAQC